jgi:hypothetical protein
VLVRFFLGGGTVGWVSLGDADLVGPGGRGQPYLVGWVCLGRQKSCSSFTCRDVSCRSGFSLGGRSVGWVSLGEAYLVGWVCLRKAYLVDRV